MVFSTSGDPGGGAALAMGIKSVVINMIEVIFPPMLPRHG
tara:strand:- start:183 stop:302 length:120 start_codon:yes stop_codon:yes gene_type:complete